MNGPSKNPLDRARAAVGQISLSLSSVAGMGLVILSIAITVDILTRKLLHWSIQGTDELGGYILAFVAVFGFPYALMNRAHTRVDVVTALLGRSWHVASNIFAYVTILLYALFIAWFSITSLMESLQYGAVANSPWQTPLWIPQGITAAGCVFFALAALILLGHLLYYAATRQPAADSLYSPPTADDELNQVVSEMNVESMEGTDHAR
jgi:TRAP-type C4-dicarboxylate transport system permease small subunit